MSNIYCISGLGADHRLFGHLSIPGYDLVHLPWQPVAPNDTMATYAMKMAALIPETQPTIIGLSLGGMLTSEIARQMPVKKAILVSSAKTRAELGYSNPLLGQLRKLIPAALFGYPFSLVLNSLGATTAEEKQLLRHMINDSDPVLVKACVGLLLSWNATSHVDGLVHIHGTTDRVILSAAVKPTHWIEGGSHIMIYNRAEEVSAIIAAQL